MMKQDLVDRHDDLIFIPLSGVLLVPRHAGVVIALGLWPS